MKRVVNGLLVVLLVAAGLVLPSALTAIGLAPTASASVPNPPGLPDTVTEDPLPTWQINGVVWSQAVVGTTVYAGGSFTSARPPGSAAGSNEVARSNLLAYDITTGNLVTSFAPVVNGQVKAVAASPDGTRLYIGGDFTTVAGATHTRIAAFDTATGQLANWQPSASGTVDAIAATNATVYFGGAFSSVTGTARNRLAAVNAASAALSTWAPVIDSGGINAMTLTPDKSRLIVGGRFTRLNGIATAALGSVDAVTGATMPFAFGQDEKNGPNNSSGIYSLAADDKYVYGTGWAFGSGNFEGAFAASPATGQPTWVEDCWGDTYTIAPINGVVYTGSHEHDCSSGGLWPSNGDHRHAQAWSVVPSSVNNVIDGRHWDYSAFKRPNLFNFNPDWQVGTYTGQSQAVWNIAASGDYVAMAGEFLSVNGKAQQGLVRFTKHAKAPNKYGPTASSLGTISASSVQASGTRTVKVDLTRAAFDPDDTYLTYQLIRNGATTSPVATATVPAPGWWEPNAGVPVSLVDSAPPAQSTSYQVVARDGGGKTVSTNTVQIAASTGALGLSPLSIAFGSLATGSSAQATVTVSNTGAGPLTVSKIVGSGAPFTAAPDLTGKVVPAGGSLKTTVTYAPAGSSNGDTGSLTVTTNDGRSATVTLTGSTVGGTVNYALGARAGESSVADGATANLAVDGNTDGVFSDGSVTYTNADPYSWWKVDLGASHSLNQVVVWNRTDCCGSKLANYRVFVSEKSFDTSLTPTQQAAKTGVVSVKQTSAPNPSTTITLPAGTSGRYVMIQEGTHDKNLSLAEVQVLGSR